MSDHTPRLHYTEYMRLDDFIARFYPANPKSHDLGKIHVAVKEFGFVESPTIDEQSGYVVAGHGRAETLWQQMTTKAQTPDGIQVDDDGMWKLPVTRGVHFKDESQVKAYIVASNNLTIQGGWHDDILVDDLQDLLAEDVRLLHATGFDEDDLDQKIYELNPTFDPSAEWEGMPEFEQDAIKPFHSIHVHFKTEDDMIEFAELLEQVVTDRTKYIYYPKQEQIDGKSYQVVNES